MLQYFKTLKRHSSNELIVKRSRFIGHAAPVSSEDEALRLIEAIRKEHATANHNCFAYVVGDRDQWQKFSDDGEPGGTAGKPIMEVIKHQGLKNTIVVVTRYFGGIMLGAGGLVRAYTEGAALGIEAAEPVYQVLHSEIQVEIDYTWLGKVENELRGRGILTGETEFTDKVKLRCFPLAREADAFISWMTDLTQGKGTITARDQVYMAHKEAPSA